jgi:hypothetical protein
MVNMMKISLWYHLSEFAVCIIRLLVFITIIEEFGIVLGLVDIYSLISLYDFLVYKILNLERLNSFDKFFITDDDRKRATLIIFMRINNLDELKLKNLIFERLIKKIRKFRCKIKYTLFDFYWTEINQEAVYKKLMNTPCIETNEENMKDFVQKEINSPCDLFNDVLYEFKMYKHENGKGTLLFKFDHAMSDGLGVMAALCAMSDDYSIDIFPKSVQQQKIPFYKYIIDFFMLFPLTLEYFKLPKKENSLIKENIQQQETLVSFSKVYNFEDWTKINKRLRITFNEFIITVILSSFKTYYIRNNKPVPSYISSVIPIGAKGIPKTVEESKVTNLTGITETHLIPETDILMNAKKVSKVLKADVANTMKPILRKIFSSFFHQIVPNFLYDFATDQMLHFIDLTISNVPGPRKTLMLNGMEVTDLIPIANPGRLFAFLPIVTYNNRLSVCFCVDKTVEIDPSQIISIIDETYKKVGSVEKVD